MHQNTKDGCPFCLDNNLLRGTILAQNSTFFAVESDFSEGSYLVIPIAHAESLLDLPDDCWKDFKAILKKLSMPAEYNLSINFGKNAGQSVKHLHWWIIPRHANVPSAGKGLARLILENDRA